MAFSIANTASSGGTLAASESLNFDASGGTSGSRILVAYVAHRDGDSDKTETPTCTFNGVSMTEIATILNSGEATNLNRLTAFYLCNPDETTANVTGTYATAKDKIIVGAVLIADIFESAPEAWTTGEGVNVNSVNMSVMTLSPSPCVLYVVITGDGVITPSGYTEDIERLTGDLRMEFGHETGPATRSGTASGSASWSTNARPLYIALSFREDGPRYAVGCLTLGA